MRIKESYPGSVYDLNTSTLWSILHLSSIKDTLSEVDLESSKTVLCGTFEAFVEFPKLINLYKEDIVKRKSNEEYNPRTKKWYPNQRKRKCLKIWSLYCKHLFPLLKGKEKGKKVALLLYLETRTPPNFLFEWQYPSTNNFFLQCCTRLSFYQSLLEKYPGEEGWKDILDLRGICGTIENLIDWDREKFDYLYSEFIDDI